MPGALIPYQPDQAQQQPVELVPSPAAGSGLDSEAELVPSPGAGPFHPADTALKAVPSPAALGAVPSPGAENLVEGSLPQPSPHPMAQTMPWIKWAAAPVMPSPGVEAAIEGEATPRAAGLGEQVVPSPGAESLVEGSWPQPSPEPTPEPMAQTMPWIKWAAAPSPRPAVPQPSPEPHRTVLEELTRTMPWIEWGAGTSPRPAAFAAAHQLLDTRAGPAEQGPGEEQRRQRAEAMARPTIQIIDSEIRREQEALGLEHTLQGRLEPPDARSNQRMPKDDAGAS